MSLFEQDIKEANMNQFIEVASISIPENEEIETSLQEDNVATVSFSGHIDGGNQMKIRVYTNEGQNIPHFHIENDKGFSCCVMIYECNYFIHSWHQNTLIKKQAKELDKTLRRNYKSESITIWQKIVEVWNSGLVNNPKVIPDASAQPDYTQLSSISLPKENDDQQDQASNKKKYL